MTNITNVTNDAMQTTQTELIEDQELTLDYAKRMLRTELQIKQIQNDRRLITAEAKDDGIQIGTIKKTIADLKKQKKLDDLEKQELNNFFAVFEQDVELNQLLEQLTQKDD